MQAVRDQRLPLVCAYTIEVLTAISVNLLMNGISFYTTRRFGWNTSQNLLLMMTQGAAYATGALSAGVLSRHLPKTWLLLGVSAALSALILAMSFGNSPWVIIPILLICTFVSTLTWPLVESLITEGCDAVRMNRRITIYNMCWSGPSVVVIAAYGTILQYWPAGPMLIPLICHGIALVAAIVLVKTHRAPSSAVVQQDHGDATIAAKLAHQRRTTLWLARLSLPASFVIANSLMGLFPKLAIASQIGLVWSTVLASLWMASRFFTFIVLGMTSWWHTRPRLLIGGGLLMLLAFLMIVLPAERLGLFADRPVWMIVTLIAIAELVLGIVAGFVFSASLYFGMVLSDGSAEHGSYHEALIGTGMVIGPGLAAGAQAMSSSGSSLPAIAAVSTLMVMTLAGAVTISARSRVGSPNRPA